MSEPFLGEIIMFGGNFAPRGWVFCNGSLLPIAQNTALFAVIGTIYGGDAETTFGVPDLRDRVPMHHGSGPGLTPRTIGQKGGVANVALSVSQIPNHSHDLSGHNNEAGQTMGQNQGGNTDQDLPGPTRSFGSRPGSESNPFGGGVDVYGPLTPSNGVAMPDATAPRGGGAAHANEQPYQAINFIIAITGTFPSRN